MVDVASRWRLQHYLRTGKQARTAETPPASTWRRSPARLSSGTLRPSMDCHIVRTQDVVRNRMETSQPDPEHNFVDAGSTRRKTVGLFEVGSRRDWSIGRSSLPI